MAKKIDLLGEKIKELREEIGLTQEELAQCLFLDKSTIAKYETNKIQPSLQNLIDLAVFFQVSTDYLLGLED